MSFDYSPAHLHRDENLKTFKANYRNFKTVGMSQVGQQIVKLLESRFAVSAIVASVLAAPTRPPVAAVEHLLRTKIGDAAFTDPAKQFTGRIIRGIVEHLGGTHVRRGTPIRVPSRYSKGSVYDFPTMRQSSD